MAMQFEQLSPVVRFGLGVFTVCTAAMGVAIAIDATDLETLPLIAFAFFFAAACAYGAISGRFPNPQGPVARRQKSD